jgi:hypothetical protein
MALPYNNGWRNGFDLLLHVRSDEQRKYLGHNRLYRRFPDLSGSSTCRQNRLKRWLRPRDRIGAARCISRIYFKRCNKFGMGCLAEVYWIPVRAIFYKNYQKNKFGSVFLSFCPKSPIQCDSDQSYVTKRRNKAAALKFMKKSMKWYRQPEVVFTDKLRPYGAAMKVIGNAAKQETGRWKNNRVENSHLPFRRRERARLRSRRTRIGKGRLRFPELSRRHEAARALP